jgi:hypothetical protein
MYIYDGGVVIFSDGTKGGKAFNDIKKADRYFDRKLKAGKNPCWMRIFKKDAGYEANLAKKG